jgi:hypothetical protein
MCKNGCAMANKKKAADQKEAAYFVAGLILDSLEQFPKKERDARLSDIHKALAPRKVKPQLPTFV